MVRTPASTAEGASSIPGQGTKIPQAVGYGQKKEREGGREDGGQVGILMTEGELGGGMSSESPSLCSASHPWTEHPPVLQSLKCCHS